MCSGLSNYERATQVYFGLQVVALPIFRETSFFYVEMVTWQSLQTVQSAYTAY